MRLHTWAFWDASLAHSPRLPFQSTQTEIALRTACLMATGGGDVEALKAFVQEILARGAEDFQSRVRFEQEQHLSYDPVVL
jgi:hypothetical protein